jgi:hypothetical protein
MVYVCKLYANGTLEQTATFQTLLEAERWASENARVVDDTRYTVSIYGDVKEGVDLNNMFPLAIFLQ